MPRFPVLSALCCLVGAALLSSSCASSYQTEQLARTIEQICRDEYHYAVSSKLEGRTLAVLLQHDGVMEQVGGQVALSDGANEILGNMIETLHRVLLSTDAPIQFYVLLVYDRSVPGVYLSLVRYIDDVRKVNAQMMGPMEFFSRTLLELKMANAEPVELSKLQMRDIRLEEFLSWQLAKRIQSHLTERLQRAGLSPAGGGGLSDMQVGQCEGRYEGGEFTFALNVTPPAGHTAPLEETKLQEVFQEATSVIAEVLADYRFDRFTMVRLVHPPTGRTLLLPKARLDVFR
jgi:hypothetical protein